jgi:rubredoxin
MDKYVCSICGYVYEPESGDPQNGVPPGTAFNDLPDDWKCPICDAEKDMFEPTPKFKMCCFIAKKKKSIDIEAFRKFVVKHFNEKKEFDEYLEEFKS